MPRVGCTCLSVTATKKLSGKFLGASALEDLAISQTAENGTNSFHLWKDCCTLLPGDKHSFVVSETPSPAAFRESVHLCVCVSFPFVLEESAGTHRSEKTRVAPRPAHAGESKGCVKFSVRSPAHHVPLYTSDALKGNCASCLLYV